MARREVIFVAGPWRSWPLSCPSTAFGTPVSPNAATAGPTSFVVWPAERFSSFFASALEGNAAVFMVAVENAGLGEQYVYTVTAAVGAGASGTLNDECSGDNDVGRERARC